jgi:hypothetical protein
MNHTFKIIGLHTLPAHGGHSDVLAKVNWEMVFTQDGHDSVSAGETMLDVDSISSFTPFAEVTEQQVEDWVIAKEGGAAFISMLEGIHGPIFARKALDAKTVIATPSFKLAQPSAVRSMTYDLSQID